MVAGLTLRVCSSFAHDFYANVISKGKATENEEVRVARIGAFVIGAVAIASAHLPAEPERRRSWSALAFAVAASANLPAILYSLFWKRFNTRGAVWAIYGGLVSAVVLVFSPVVSGAPTAMFEDGMDVPADQPGHHLDPVRLLPRVARIGDQEGQTRGEVRRTGGALPHRCRCPLAPRRAGAGTAPARRPFD